MHSPPRISSISQLVNWLIVCLFLGAILIPWGLIVPNGFDLNGMLLPPSLLHPLGTDNLGRDVLLRFSQAIWCSVLPLWLGVLTSSFLGCVAAVVALQLKENQHMATVIRLISLVGVVTVSIPIGLLAFSWAALNEQTGLMPVLVSVCVVFMMRNYLQIFDFYRLDARKGFWEAHASLGGGLYTRIVKYGVLGEWKWGILESLSFHLKAAVAIEASLSYLGFGIQEPTPSFGNMLASHFDLYLKGDWHILALIVAALALCAASPNALWCLTKQWLEGAAKGRK